MIQNTDSRSLGESDLNNNDCNSLHLWTSTIQILLPVAAIAFIWGRRGLLARFFLQFDKNCISVICPSLKEKQKLLQWIEWHIPTKWFHINNSSLDRPLDFWKDGSLLCNLLNSFIPGACPNPRSHRHHPPSHGQALVYKYLGIAPVFTESEFSKKTLNCKQEHELGDYLQQIRETCEKETTSSSNYSSNYIAKGMGLVSGEENRKTCFYIYVNSFDSFNANDLIISIQAPNHIYETLSIPSNSIKQKLFPHLFSNNLTYRSYSERLLLKPISNFASLSELKRNKVKVPMQFSIEDNRVKVVYIPRGTGIYNVSIITNGSHILGSPFPVSVSENSHGDYEDMDDINPMPTLTIKKTVKKTILSQGIDFFDKGEINKTENQKAEENIKINVNKASPICKDHIENEVTESHSSSLIPYRNHEKITDQENPYYNYPTNRESNFNEEELHEVAEGDQFQDYANDNNLHILNYLPHLKYNRSVSCNELNNDNTSPMNTLDDHTDYYLEFKDRLSFWESRLSINNVEPILKQGRSLPDLISDSAVKSSFEFYEKSEFKSKQQYWKFLSSQTIDCMETTSYYSLPNACFGGTEFKSKFKERREFWEQLSSRNCSKEYLYAKKIFGNFDSTFSNSESFESLKRDSPVDLQTIDHSVFEKRQHFWKKLNKDNVTKFKSDKNNNVKMKWVTNSDKPGIEQEFSNYCKNKEYEMDYKNEDKNLTDDLKCISGSAENMKARFYKSKNFFRSLEASIR